MRSVALSALLALAVTVSANEDEVHSFERTSVKAPFLEQFTDDWSERWTPSEATKKTAVGGETWSYVGKWEVEEPTVLRIQMRSVALSALLALAVTVSANEDEVHSFERTSVKAPFLEQFTDDWSERWTPSEATKKTAVGGETWSYVGKWEVEEPTVLRIQCEA